MLRAQIPYFCLFFLIYTLNIKKTQFPNSQLRTTLFFDNVSELLSFFKSYMKLTFYKTQDILNVDLDLKERSSILNKYFPSIIFVAKNESKVWHFGVWEGDGYTPRTYVNMFCLAPNKEDAKNLATPLLGARQNMYPYVLGV